MTAPLHRLASALLLGLSAACGASDATQDSPVPATEQPFRAGALVGSTLGPVGISTTNSSDVLVTGFTGRFTRLDYGAGGNENDFPIYTAAIERTPALVSHIYRILAGSGEPVQLTNGARNEYRPSIDPSGTRIAYWEGNAQGEVNNGVARLMVMPAGGGAAEPVDTIETISRYRPEWSPDGQSLLFEVQDTMGFMKYVVRLTLATRVLDTLFVTTNEVQRLAVGMVDGIATVIVPAPDGFMTIRLTTKDTATIMAGTRSFESPYLAPDGKSMAYRSGTQLFRVSLPGYTDSRLIGDAGTWPIAWLPDASGFVIAVNTEVQPNAIQLFLMDTLGVYQRQITHAGLELGFGHTIGPRSHRAPARRLIGPGAELADSASGLLVAQGVRAALKSVLAFDAGDPASATIQTLTGLNSSAPFLTVSLTADRITRLAHLDLFQGIVTRVVEATTAPVSGALATFNAGDGTIALVLLYGAEGPPTVHDEGATRIFETRDSVIRLH